MPVISEKQCQKELVFANVIHQALGNMKFQMQISQMHLHLDK